MPAQARSPGRGRVSDAAGRTIAGRASVRATQKESAAWIPPHSQELTIRLERMIQ